MTTNLRIFNAIKKAIEGPICAYYPLSDLPRNPILNSDVIAKDDNHYSTAWFADGDCYGEFDWIRANEIKEEMCEELKTALKSRNLVAEVNGTVVQEFQWNHQRYDLNNHGLNWLVLLDITILDKIGTIYKNNEDYSDEIFNDATSQLLCFLKT